MATKLDIVNRALEELAAAPIAALSPDDSPNAATAYRIFDPLFDAMLAEHPWSFATSRRQLALVAGDPPAVEWAYRFAQPADTLRFWRVLGQYGTERSTPYILRTDASSGLRQVYTNTNPCWADVTLRVETTRLPAIFEQALVSRLASRMAMPVTRGKISPGDLLQRSVYELAAAKTQDWNEHPSPEFDDGDNKLNAKYG